MEIGTRNGDGMACFAQVASRSIAVEIVPSYCDWLRTLSIREQNRTGGRGFEVLCQDYRSLDLSAIEVFTWWMVGGKWAVGGGTAAVCGELQPFDWLLGSGPSNARATVQHFGGHPS